MKGMVLFSLMAAGVILFAGAAIGLSYTKYDELTTTIDLDDGITCTLNGKEVSNGETVTIRQDMGTVRVHLESEYPIPIISTDTISTMALRTRKIWMITSNAAIKNILLDGGADDTRRLSISKQRYYSINPRERQALSCELFARGRTAAARSAYLYT